MKKKIIHISALVGVIIFIVMVYRIGPMHIWENLKKLSWQDFMILMGLRLCYWVLRSVNWKVILAEYGESASLAHIFTARMCSHAVTQLTPTAAVGGEAARIFMLKCRDRKASFASVVIDKTIEFMTVIVFCIIGLVILLMRIPLPPQLKIIFIAATAVSALITWFIFVKQRKGVLSWTIHLLSKIRIRPRVFERNKETIKETDEYISDFYLNHTRAFFRASLLYGLLLMLWSVEIHLTLVFIGVTDISFVDSFLLTMLGNLAYLFPFIPGALGVYEATYVGLFALLGRGGGVGFTMVLVRRVLELAWAAIGLLGLLKLGGSGEKATLGAQAQAEAES